MMDMIKQYKDLKTTIEQLMQGTRVKRSNSISHKSGKLEFGLCKTTKELIFKRCIWYYKYKKLSYNYLSFSSIAIIKFG